MVEHHLFLMSLWMHKSFFISFATRDAKLFIHQHLPITYTTAFNVIILNIHVNLGNCKIRVLT